MPPCLWTNQIFHCWGCREFEHIDYKRDCSHLFSLHLLLRMFALSLTHTIHVTCLLRGDTFLPNILHNMLTMQQSLASVRSLLFNGLVDDIFAFFLSLTPRQPYWEFEIQGVSWCPQYEIEGENTSCIFYFSICKEVPQYCPAGSGICWANKVSPEKYPNITLYTRFIDIGTASEDFKSGRTLVLFRHHSQ